MENLKYQVQRIVQISPKGITVVNLTTWDSYSEAKAQISQFREQTGITYQIVIFEDTKIEL